MEAKRFILVQLIVCLGAYLHGKRKAAIKRKTCTDKFCKLGRVKRGSALNFLFGNA